MYTKDLLNYGMSHCDSPLPRGVFFGIMAFPQRAVK
jgi:hypothetical protein